MRKIITILILLVSLFVDAQNWPDKIIITKRTYVRRIKISDTLYKTQEEIITNKRVIKELLTELNKVDDKKYLLSKFKIDTFYIKNNYEKLLKLYSGEYKIDWNIKQKQFIYDELRNLANYQKVLERYLSEGCCYSMHESYSNQYVVEFFFNNKFSNRYSSRKSVWGYQFPWTDENDNQIFNYKIEKEIYKLFNIKKKREAPMEGTELLKYLVNKIIDNNVIELYKLSAYTYLNEINELKSVFNVLSFEEVFGRGRYIWDEQKTFQISLHNNTMLQNVNIQLMCTKVGNTLYSRDSLLTDYKNIIDRVQNITFIKDYISNNSDSKLDIYYFNNKPINDYNIESVNKNPTEWKKQDDYIESLRLFKKQNINPNFDFGKAIKTSEEVYCGCNYRYERSFIENAIFFELTDEEMNKSIWFLLPDNRVLLYIMDGEKLLDNIEFEKHPGIQYPCKIFNTKGEPILK